MSPKLCLLTRICVILFTMNTKKYRWSTVYESAEEELIDFLGRRHITATRHEIESDSTYQILGTSTGLRMWCAEGSAKLMINNQYISLQPGDALNVPENVACIATTSLSNFTWYEAPGLR